MRISLHPNSASHQMTFLSMIGEGAVRLGHTVEDGEFDVPSSADVMVVWGWKRPRIKESGRPVLVMEAGAVHPRLHNIQLGWNGLGRRAVYPEPNGHDRWSRLNTRPPASWTERKSNKIAIMGQVEVDAAVDKREYRAWAASAADTLLEIGLEPLWRPHPNAPEAWRPSGIGLAPPTLGDTLELVEGVCVYNSTSGTDALLAGVPVCAHDQGAMCWDASTHSLEHGFLQIDREPWVRWLSWTMWTHREIQNGQALEALLSCVPH